MIDSSTHRPRRTCVGCRAIDDQARLVRIAAPAGQLCLDLRRTAGGRGGYVHRRSSCLASCLAGSGRTNLARTLRQGINGRELAALVAQVSPIDDNSPGQVSPQGDHRSQTPPSLLDPDAVERPLRNQAKDDRSEDARV